MILILKILALYPPLTAWVVFIVLHYIKKYRADRIMHNVGTFLPEITDRQQFVRDFHKDWAANIAETCIVFAGTTPRQVRKAVTFTNISVLHDHFAAGHKVLLVSAHTANTDWVWQGVSLEFEDHDLSGIGTDLDSGTLGVLAHKARTRYGNGKSFSSDAVGRDLIAAHHSTDLLYVIGDFKPKSHSNPHRDLLPFLAHKSYMYSSIPRLGRLMGMHLVYMDMQRTSLGRFQVTFTDLSPPPEKADLPQVQSAYMAQIENSIRTRPQAWWFWPKQFPDRTKQSSNTDQFNGPAENK